MSRNILITGGAGFIGSHVVERFVNKYPDYQITVLDKLTYASNPDWLFEEVEKCSNLGYATVDICDYDQVLYVLRRGEIDTVIHLAAESHVDNSIDNPMEFVNTNIIGTVQLLNAVKKYWGENPEGKLFYHISTDEVFGALDYSFRKPFDEETSYDPQSPYSASKASSDHFVRAYGNTYKIPYVISNCSNNYGPRQHEEKLLPKAIKNLIQGKKIPIYGMGENIRDWLYVEDHVRAIDVITHKGKVGETYCIGGDSEMRNIELIKKVIELCIGDVEEKHQDFIEFVSDRKGHDFRYAIDHSKITKNLGWSPLVDIMGGLKLTIEYYKEKFK